MSMMLIAIAAVVIIGIILAVVMMKKKDNASTATPLAPKASNRPKTLAEQQQERELQAQSLPPTSMPTPTPVDSIVAAQNLVDKKDYPAAITLLKSAIAAQPNRSDLQLLLLNIYAQQNNHNDFYTQYDNLMQLNDPASHAQANKLKALIDEEHAFQTHKAMPSAAPLAAAAVAGTATAIAVSNHAAPTESADTIDFDGLDMFQTDPTPAVVEKSAPVVTEPEDDFSFDFDLDTTPNVSAVTQTESKVTEPLVSLETPTKEEDDFTFDLSDELNTHSPSLHASETPSVSLTPSTPATLPVTEDNFNLDDLDFDLSSPAPTETVTPTQVVAPAPTVPTEVSKPVPEDFDFDMSFDEPATTVYAPISTEPSIATHGSTHTATNTASLDEQEFSFDLEDFSNTTKPVIETSPIPPVTNTVVDSTLTLASTPTEHALDLPTTKVEEHFDAFSFDLATPDPIAAPTLAEAAPVIATAPVITAAMPQATPTVSAPVLTEDLQDFSPVLNAVKDLDHHQILLELAQQYIQLGEYDSAKRLLNELHAVSPTHQTTANQLLASID